MDDKRDIITFKLISGEEIICHINREDLESGKSSVVVHDPYKIIMYQEKSAFAHWIISNDASAIDLPKTMIMMALEPVEIFTTMYNDIIRKKYNTEDIPKETHDDSLMTVH